jgi:hypothetical protein
MDTGIIISILAIIVTILGTGVAIIALNYQFIRNFKEDMNEKFKIHEKRFEKIDQRLFLLCLGKDLPSILKSEREEK